MSAKTDWRKKFKDENKILKKILVSTGQQNVPCVPIAKQPTELFDVGRAQVKLHVFLAYSGGPGGIADRQDIRRGRAGKNGHL